MSAERKHQTTWIDRRETRSLGDSRAGDGWLYAYTFPALLEPDQTLDPQRHVLMKIGRTTEADPELRIRRQLGASNVEPARLLLLLARVWDPVKAETDVHRRLSRWDRRVAAAPGKEWFRCSLEEVELLTRPHLASGSGVGRTWEALLDALFLVLVWLCGKITPR